MAKKKAVAPKKDLKLYSLNKEENMIVDNLEVTDVNEILRIYKTRNIEVKKHFDELEE
jgi:hypothetical protein